MSDKRKLMAVTFSNIATYNSSVFVTYNGNNYCASPPEYNLFYHLDHRKKKCNISLQ